MNNQFVKIILFLVCLNLTNALYSQQVFVATGGSGQGTGGIIDFSIGQMCFVNESPRFNQGIQYPHVITFAVGGLTTLRKKVLCLVYPNPAKSYLNLKVDNALIQDFVFTLVDLKGKVCRRGKVVNIISRIDICDLPSTTYFLKIENTGSVYLEDTECVKIIKHK